MKLGTLPFILTVLILILAGCKDSADFEEVKIEPVVSNSSDTTSSDLYVCVLSTGFRKFEAVGKYSDGSDKDLTEDVTWTSDASDDSVLSSTINGLVYCNSDWGKMGLKVTYSLSTSESGSEKTEYTDTVIVDVQ